MKWFLSLRRSPVAMMALSSVLAVCCLVVAFCCLAGGSDKFTNASSSSRAAKSRGVFLWPVELELVDSGGSFKGLQPREAWVETVYENYESIAIRKYAVGKRLCMRFDEPSAIRHSLGLKIFLNETKVRASSVGNASGTTFEFSDEYHQWHLLDGNVVFVAPNDEGHCKIRFSVKKVEPVTK